MGEGPKSLLFGGGARGGSGSHCKEDDHRDDTDNSYICSNRIYMGPEKQTITFAKNALNIESRRREPPVVWIC